MIAFLAVTGTLGIVAVFVLVMRLEDHLDRKAPRPPARLPAAGAARAGGRALPTARRLPGTIPQVDHEWLAAPLDVPGRESPSPPIPVGDSAPVSSVAAGAAHPAGDLVTHPPMGYWDGHPDTYGTPAPAPVLDYRPRAPFCLWEDDDFVEGLAAIKDGA